jgi:flagellar secretion chaperone FliS
VSFAHRYARSQAETASPERLMVLLFERALQHMRVGAAALEQGRPAAANEPLAKAGDILVELHATLDPRRAPELCERLGEVYRFAIQRLLEGNLARDAAKVREAERAFSPLAEAFAAAVQQAGGER